MCACACSLLSRLQIAVTELDEAKDIKKRFSDQLIKLIESTEDTKYDKLLAVSTVSVHVEGSA